jgi:hypothetical protein
MKRKDLVVEGEIEIHRVSGIDDDNRAVRIVVKDAVARCEFLEVSMSLKTFAEALFARGGNRCELRIRGLDVLGLKAEHKEELVPVKDFSFLESDLEAMRKFEVDGWKGDRSDLENHHRRGNGVCRVRFFRHVPRRELP